MPEDLRRHTCSCALLAMCSRDTNALRRLNNSAKSSMRFKLRKPFCFALLTVLLKPTGHGAYEPINTIKVSGMSQWLSRYLSPKGSNLLALTLDHNRSIATIGCKPALRALMPMPPIPIKCKCAFAPAILNLPSAIFSPLSKTLVAKNFPIHAHINQPHPPVIEFWATQKLVLARQFDQENLATPQQA
ncbi:MAG: hypothetical protein R2865_10635 [Deinococcales bacterium]